MSFCANKPATALLHAGRRSERPSGVDDPKHPGLASPPTGLIRSVGPLASHQILSPVTSSNRLAQDDAQERRRIDVRDRRRRRSSTRSATPSVRCAGLRGSFKSRSRRFALRTSSDGAANGTICATGVSRSSTVTVPLLRTDRRCSLRRAFKSAIRTRIMTNGHNRFRRSTADELAGCLGRFPQMAHPCRMRGQRLSASDASNVEAGRPLPSCVTI